MCDSKLYFGCRSFDSEGCYFLLRPADEVSQSLKDWGFHKWVCALGAEILRPPTANQATVPVPLMFPLPVTADFFGSHARCIANFHSIPSTSNQTFLYLRVIRLINDYSTVGMKNIALDICNLEQTDRFENEN